MSSVPAHIFFWLPIARTILLFAVLLAAAAGSQAQPGAKPQPLQPIANFVDMADKAGLTMWEIFGGVDTKKYIIETTGTGVALLDYDNDGWLDIFIVNGTTLEASKTGRGPTNHLYRNNHGESWPGGADRLGARRLRG